MTTNESNQILAKSENCIAKLTQWITQVNRAYALEKYKFTFLVLGPSIIIAILSIIKEDGYSFLIEDIFITCICLAIINHFSKPNKKIVEQYNKYELLCRTETLIVDTKQVYGKTEDTDFSLLYGDISDVKHITQPTNIQKTDLGFENDILEIVTFDNQTYRFLSFSNTNELAEIIKKNIR